MNRNAQPYRIDSTYLRLRSDVAVEPLPVDEEFWPKLVRGDFGDFHKEYLVSSHEFDRDWGVWEMHPNGDEMVCLLDGNVTFVLEQDGGNREIRLANSGEYVVVPKGTWHTARVDVPSRMLFITAGEGTQHREAS